MSAITISGKALADEIQRSLAERVEGLKSKLGRPPGLAVVLVGENPASQVYVRSKSKNAKKCGIHVVDRTLPATTSNEALHRTLNELNHDPEVDGILLQLPLPKGLDEFSALLCISPEKDADGLHPTNQGLLLRGADAPRPCTPFGVMKLIDRGLTELGASTDLSGKHAVVVGRSILVGKPAAMMLLERNCTVEICHSKSADLRASCRRADILVAAVGRPKMITADHIKPGAIVIDVGINQDTDGKLCGDVDFDSAVETAGALTPVPGGVGPMTIAMLLSNTVDAAARRAR
ncbi:MAG: bifunctional methylenetetrahydrofolate dehydrogenase/methenyltetrahydrofolate cyclohydrolase FolD [Bdellovibrionota bacterium]